MNDLAEMRERRCQGQHVPPPFYGPNPEADYILRYAKKLVEEYGPVFRPGRAYVYYPVSVENETTMRITSNDRGPGQLQYDPTESDGFSAAKNYRVNYIRTHNVTGNQAEGTMALRGWDALYMPAGASKNIWNKLREYIDGRTTIAAGGRIINRYISPSDIEMTRVYDEHNIPEDSSLLIQSLLNQSRRRRRTGRKGARRKKHNRIR